MLDRFNRRINSLRISVTDRCNLRCTYCMPAEGVVKFSHRDILSFEEIVNVIEVGIKFGVTKIRLTGGEPLVRKDILQLVSMIAQHKEITDFGLTTNGIYLEEQAQALKNSGLMRVNVSLDAMNPEKYRKITRGGDINKVLRGIKAAQSAGLNPVKINCVVMKSSNEPDAKEVKNFALENNLSVRYIHQMNLETGEFSVVEGGDGGNCHKCNRLRLTSNGKLKPCLFDEHEFDIRQMSIEQAFMAAINCKPERGCINRINHFSNIGG